jgi:hypothetical protein
MFSMKMDIFVGRLDDMAAVVRSFDHVICEKSSKTDFLLLRQEFENKFITQYLWEQMLIKYDKVKQDIHASLATYYDKFKMYEKESEGIISDRCGELVDKKYKNYDKVAKSFRKFFAEDALEH